MGFFRKFEVEKFAPTLKFISINNNDQLEKIYDIRFFLYSNVAKRFWNVGNKCEFVKKFVSWKCLEIKNICIINIIYYNVNICINKNTWKSKCNFSKIFNS